MFQYRNIRGFACGVFMSAVAATSAGAAVIYDSSVNHGSEVATAASKLAASLSTSASGYSGSDAAGRGAAIGSLTSSDILFLGQNDATSSVATAAEEAAIKSFVEGGGTLLRLWGSGFPPDLSLLSFVAGESFTGVYERITSSSKTAAATGTSFDSVVATLTGASDHGGIDLSSLGGATSMFESATASHIAVKSVGAGHVAFLSWDWCCFASDAVRGEWDEALLAAATYDDDGVSPVPLPAGLPLLGVGLFALAAVRKRKGA